MNYHCRTSDSFLEISTVMIHNHNVISETPGVALKASNASKLPVFHINSVLVAMATPLLNTPSRPSTVAYNGIPCLLRAGVKQPLCLFVQLEPFRGLVVRTPALRWDRSFSVPRNM